ncbi:Zn-dependent hydrolase of the beta-lactamase fold, putative [Metarhizium acridum CQMa 102]|uniref:Zn-dependent hydrolase of the beta-lactamase fold, putative n=1 Tax=Metarhizium acridum (strain CQMa 102) TaxID=655827 RepID=E9EH09_METAQ|nr:Zn-dependent hydrolase of the beta-lactamase fold, putative [Metarhizium acridum CQMa 102]EFY84794.1 Zn-dependent hydrolase of the beta-lactamase fold, putative [Metarhizium acridum CQMa 102]
MTSLNIAFIGTATAVLDINGINFITGPLFSLAGTEWDQGIIVLKAASAPALSLADLPVIDAVLLSHEDHPDTLDGLGRRLLDGRRVFTTRDGANKLAPRPGHLPGGECVGFVLSGPEFGQANRKPNGIYFSGDTVYMEELTAVKDKFHIRVALLSLGAASVPVSTRRCKSPWTHRIRWLKPGVETPII